MQSEELEIKQSKPSGVGSHHDLSKQPLDSNLIWAAVLIYGSDMSI